MIFYDRPWSESWCVSVTVSPLSARAEGAIQTLEGGNNFDMVFTDSSCPEP